MGGTHITQPTERFTEQVEMYDQLTPKQRQLLDIIVLEMDNLPNTRDLARRVGLSPGGVTSNLRSERFQTALLAFCQGEILKHMPGLARVGIEKALKGRSEFWLPLVKGKLFDDTQRVELDVSVEAKRLRALEAKWVDVVADSVAAGGQDQAKEALPPPSDTEETAPFVSGVE